ncbi:unnamed protein product [Rhizoctonia solani]|uniref:Uncharacterized protein n=1 Tax=Rhizoctonia solani TaxID=456999 RepID=A0A8H2W5S2_9AGAM|nr:unnamed protein product [Rhizoctonia solani]
MAQSHLPLGKLSNNDWEHPREHELRALREVADDMQREAEEAEARAAQAEKEFIEFIEAMEATYDGDQAGIDFFRSEYSEEQIELQARLDERREAYKEEEEVRYIAEKENIRREIRALDKKLDEMKKEEAKKERNKAVVKLDSLMAKMRG